MHKLGHTLLAVGRFVLAAALCAAVAVTLLSFSLQAVFTHELYGDAAQSDGFVSTLYTEAQEHLASECLFYDLPYDTMSAALPVETVRTVVLERLTAVYDALHTGETLPSATMDPAPFKAAIDSFFETLPFEERPLDPDASQTIADELSKSVALVMSIGIGDTLVKTVHPLFADTSPLRQFVDTRVWLLLSVAVLAAVSLIPFKSTLRQRAYGTAGALFIGSALMAAPTWLFVVDDLPSKLAIGDSSLKEYINAILYAVIHRTNGIATTAFVISTVLLLASVGWLVVRKKETEVAS